MTNIPNVGTVPEFELRHRMQLSRERTGLEQADFAHEVGISRATVSNVERGRTAPSELTLRAWAMRAGVPLTWLKYGETPPHDDDGVSMRAPRDSNPRPSDP